MDKKKLIIMLIVLGAIITTYVFSIVSGISGYVVECANQTMNLP